MMISQEALDNPDLAKNPVGIGMWTLDRFGPSVVTYTATPNYWDRAAQQAEHLELRYLPDDNARFNALRSGDLDTTFIRSSQVKSARSGGLEIIETSGSTTYAFPFNTSSPGLADVQVRRALQFAIDRTAIAEQLLGGRCTPNVQLWAPALPPHDDSLDLYAYDPARAKEMLAAAGHGTGLRLSLAIADIDQFRRLAEIVQAQLGEVGVKVDVKVMPPGSAREVFSVRKQVDASFGPTGLETDPSQLVSEYLAPDGLYNPGANENAEVMTRADKALAVADPAERSALYEEISRLAAEDASYLAICSPDFLFAANGEISGFKGARAAGLAEWRGVRG